MQKVPAINLHEFKFRFHEVMGRNIRYLFIILSHYVNLSSEFDILILAQINDSYRFTLPHNYKNYVTCEAIAGIVFDLSSFSNHSDAISD